MNPNPILVEIRRGGLVESLHRGAAIACDRTGRVVASWGDPAHPTFPRSAVKSIQALPLVETGAADAFGLGPEEIALAAASHTGEPVHVERVRAWLARLGLSEADLECGAPAGTAGPVFNNCSGKHTGFLSVARRLGLPTAGYIHHHHPVQQLVSAALSDMTGETAAPWGTDGCGIPTYRLKLASIATAMARMADPADQSASRRAAAEAIVASMLAHPLLVAGTGRLCTDFMRVVPRIAIKGGAEGVYAAILPERGLGVAVKIDDGAGRAAEIAIVAVLDRLGALSVAEKAALAARLSPPVLNVAGKVVGEMVAR